MFPNPAGLPSKWTFGRDLPCPECHYNLRALDRPVCPECGLQFRWQALLGVTCPACGLALHEEDGQVCPGCFTTLNWLQLLGSADPRRRFEFEHSTTLFRPFLHTLVRTLNPIRFWERERVDAPPNRARLHRYLMMSVLFGLIGLAAPLVATRAGLTYIAGADWVALVAYVGIAPAAVLGAAALYGQSRSEDSGVRADRTLRTVAFCASVLAWHGVGMLVATLICVIVNLTISAILGGTLRGPGTALHFDPNAFFTFVMTGELLWNWHPIEGWFSVGMVAVHAFIGLVWWPLFLWGGFSRGIPLRGPTALALLVVTLMMAALVTLSIWLQVIPNARIFEPWVHYDPSQASIGPVEP